MPRKKKTETVEVTEVKEEKPKATRKRKSTKKEESIPVALEFSVDEIVKWTDEECAEKDKVFKFTTTDVRDMLKSLLSMKEQLDDVNTKFLLLKNALSKGLMTGYKVECPHCKREYIVSSGDMHHDGPVLCKICGTEYVETDHITGIVYASEEDKVTVI